MDARRLVLKAAMARRGFRHRDLAEALQKRGILADSVDVGRIVQARLDPPEHMRAMIADILDFPACELFVKEEISELVSELNGRKQKR